MCSFIAALHRCERDRHGDIVVQEIIKVCQQSLANVRAFPRVYHIVFKETLSIQVFIVSRCVGCAKEQNGD
jgi:hypothetical protein